MRTDEMNDEQLIRRGIAPACQHRSSHREPSDRHAPGLCFRSLGAQQCQYGITRIARSRRLALIILIDGYREERHPGFDTEEDERIGEEGVATEESFRTVG